MQHHSPPKTALRRAKAILSALVFAATGAVAHTPPDRPHDGHADGLDALLHAYEQRIHFTENRGQFNPHVRFRADFPLGQALATPEGMLVKAYDPEAVAAREAEGHRIEEEARQGLPNRPLLWRERGHGWMLHFRGALPTMRIEGLKPHGDAANYFVGDAVRHATGVSSFEEVWYKDVYPRTDVRYYAAEDGALEYDIICKPGSDPADIQLELKGVERLRVTDKGELVVPTSLGEMLFPAPVVYQGGERGEQRVDAAYVVQGNVVRFTLGAYDRTRPLVIDPIALRWATWVNTNSSGDNHGHGIWVDPNDGAIYVLARVVGTTDNITVGAFDETANGNLEIIVGKYLEPSTVGGSGTRVWQTYIGGNNDDNPYAIEQGPDGNLYITGLTGSTNFPLLGGTGFSGTSINHQAQSGDDIFVLKINPGGTGIKACVIGGNGGELSYDLRTTSSGDVLVCGSTTSTNLLTQNPGSGATNTNAGSNDALVFRVNADLSSLVWMRNSGGSGSDVATIMLQNDATGDIFVGGSTASTNFPTVSPRQSTRGGNSAGFLQRLTSAGGVIWSSYFSSASSAAASVLCMEFNTARTELYFGGVTTGLAGANISGSGVFDSAPNGSNDFYVCRMGIDQTFIGATYLGGSGNEVNMMGLNVDQNNDVYVFGYSNSTNFPVSSAPNVPLQTTNQGSNDKTFSKLEHDLSALLFSTYYGGAADDYDPVGERGIKFSNCRIYTIVTARSNTIPLTQGALNTTKVSSTSRYEPGLVVWANPPDLLGNSITYQGVAICPGSTPGDITGSEPSYVLPTIMRNNVPSPYPSFGSAATYQWQISADSLTWTDIAGATGQDLPGSLIGAITADTYIRRIIGGDACILAGAADQVVKVRIMTASGTVTDVSCNGGSDGSVTATADGQQPFSFAWSNGQAGATATGLSAGPISVTVTDANGCSAVANFMVGQPTPLSATINTTLDACNTGTGGASASGTGGTPGYGYVWSTGAVGPNLTNVPAGPYTVTVTDLNQCAVTLPVNISGTMPPTALAGNDAEITCTTGSSVQLNGGSVPSGLNFAWTGPGIVSGAGSATPTVNVAGTYVLTVTDPQTGCTGTDQVDVTVNTMPPGAQAAGGTITCTTPCVTLQGTGNGSFVWSGPNNFSSTDQSPTVCAAGTYTLVVTGANGCTSTATADVIADNVAPQASAQGGTINCNILTAQLQGSGSGTLAWSGPGGFTSTDAAPVVNVAGTYTLTVTGTNGCETTVNADVTIDGTTASAGAVGGEISCLQPTVQLQGASLTPNVSFAWTGPNGFTSTDQNPLVSAPGSYVLTVTGTSIQTENGPLACVGTAEAIVIGNTDEPGAQAAGGTITCTNTCVTLQGTGNGSFVWSGPNNFSSTDQSPTVCAAGTYTLVVTGANGCTSTATADVDLDNDVPGAQAAGGTITCTTPCVTLQGTGNGSFVWSGPNNFSSTDQSPTVCAAGTYTLVVTGANGCTSTATADVDLDNDVPGAQAAGGTITCTTPCVTLQGTGNGSFVWSGPNNFSSTDQSPTVCAAGTYTLVVTGANGCTSTATADVDLDNDVPGAQAAGGTITCTTPCVTLQGTGNGSFVWSGPNNFSSTDQSPTVCAAGTYTLVVTGANGCTSTATADVDLDNDVPGAQAAGGTISCTTPCVTLQGTGNGSFVWSGPNNFSSTDQSPTVCAAGTYTLVVTGANGCTSTATADVDLDNDVPGAQAAGGTISCTTPCVTLQGTGNGSFVWSGPNNFSSTDQSPTVCAAGTYTLVVTGANGCTSTATADVDLDNDVPGAQAAGGTISCTTPCVTLQGTGNGSFVWSGPNNFSSTDQSPTVCAAGTYTLVVTGANGCSSTATADVDLDNDVPGAQAAGGTITCTNTCVTLQGTGNGSFVWSGPNNFSSTDQSPTVCAAGTYTLVVTGANGCTSTATADVDLDNDVPGAQAAGGTISCTTPCVTLQGTGNGSFVWSGPNNFSSTDQSPTVCAAGTYTLVVTGANGCTSTATADVDLDNDVPGAHAAGGTITCTNTCVTLQGTGNGSFVWSGPNNFSSTDQSPTVCAAGTYTLVVTGANGCSSTATADVDLDTDVPGAQAAGGTITCTNTCVTLQGSGNGSFVWSGPNNFSSTDQSPTVCAAGTYTLVVTGANGCTSTATADVDLDNDVPGAQAAGGTISCTTPCVTLQGTGNGSFVWSGPNNFSSTDQSPTVCAAGTYTLVVTGANGCTSTATADVDLDNDVPGAQAAGGTISCTTPCVTLQGTGNGSFVWSGPNNFSSTDQSPTVCAAGTYTLVVTGANGCTSTATADVDLDNDVPGAQAAGGTISCTTPCVTLQGTGNGSFVWSGPNNFSSTDQSPTVCAAGTYTLVVTGANGCTSTATADVDLDNDVPGAQAAGGTISCTTPCVTLQGTGNGSFVWSGPNNFSSTDQSPTVCAAGTYTLVVTGANGCTSTATADVDLDNDVPGAQAAGGTISCTTPCVTLQGTGNGSFVWSGPNNFSSTDQSPTVCAAGTYTLVVTGANGCTSTATADVDLDNDVPGAQAAGGTITCTTPCVTLQGSGNGSFVWSGPNNFSSTDQSPTVCAAGTYTLVVTGANGCTSTATADVDLDNNGPDLSAEATPIDCITGEATLTAISQTGITFSWTGPNGFTSSSATTTTAEAGSYTVTVTGANGCSASMEVLVIDDCDTDECGKLIEQCGPDVTVECGSSLHPYDVGHPIFRKDDKCPEVTVGWTDSWSGSCPYILTRTWWATDANGNSETCVQTITVVDTQGPELIGVPADVTVACDELSDELPEVHAVDACKNASQVMMTEVFVPGNCPGNFQLVRTWSASDDCGNTSSAMQTVTVVDNEAPVLVGVPADLTLQCDQKLPEAPVVTAEDACSANLAVILTEETIKGDCRNEFTVIRTWTVSDLCGNTATATQTIDVVDTTPPTILCSVADLETTCDKVPDPESCKASDNCDDDVQVLFTEDMSGKDCEKGYTITRTWTAVDDCGNASELVQVIMVKGTGAKSLEVTASPNPFRVMTTLRFTADRDGQAVLDLTDLQGRPVARLFDGRVERDADYQVELSADGLTGNTYLYHLMLDGRSVHGRLVLTR